MWLAHQTYLGFYFYIPVELKLVEVSALVHESTCEEHSALQSHYLENIACDPRFGPRFGPSLKQSVLYSLELCVYCVNKKFARYLHLISPVHRENFYCSYAAHAPIPLGDYESDIHLILNTDFHHESNPRL